MPGLAPWARRRLLVTLGSMAVLSPLAKAGLVLGLGLGGFADGIVLHQILGWHHLVCTTETCRPETVEVLKLQNRQDGFFHLGTWLLTLCGVALLFRAAAARRSTDPWSGRSFTGALLAGWGVFNLVEGLINHQVLGLHHVRPGHAHQLLFDLLFLAAGALLIGIGVTLCRSRAQRLR